ncbi:hypothetical protein [Polluticoccus soli]|uniref:hypothetical protein n=1 Tax=Polluticoccus soli TaxID=3034150 RepID=UPI0023E2689C|nr:hypothetical protein [Flavipsychrobacter sp. JY13-12]
MKSLEKWASIAMVNLGIVAMLGFIMRSKLLFPLPFIDFKHTLHAHSHFAFSGWVSLALLALMTFQLLPAKTSGKPIYKWLLAGIFLNAAGMLVSFLCQGYGAFSIAFSTLFIFVTYGFAYVFIKDLNRSPVNKATRLLSISSFIYLALSSVGPFTLAYLLATKSPNVVLYKDAIYTYLHLQYNGFFSLAVFALLINKLGLSNGKTFAFARLLTYSVIPSMFMSYLWHYPNFWISTIAIIGSLALVACAISFILIIPTLKLQTATFNPIVRKIGLIAMLAFILKTVLQSLTIIPSLGPLVFTNRPVIIGFLHLVLLGFISLYILAHFIQDELLTLQKSTHFGLWLFVSGIFLNEVVLMAQGLGFMLMLSSAIMQWLLWVASICLMTGAVVLAFNNINRLRFPLPAFKTTTRTFSQS